jgi:hypothetical protein
MISAVTIDRATGDGKYGDVLDIAEVLAKKDHGSATNAIAVMVRQSFLFRRTRQRLNEGNARCGASESSGQGGP